MKIECVPAPPKVEQALWTTICQVPGVILSHVTIVEEMSAGTRRLHVDIGVDGWGPSLHKLCMEWRADLPATPPMSSAQSTDEMRDKLKLDAVMPTVMEQIGIQSRRARDGLALGHARPIEEVQIGNVGHLHVDASVLAILIDQEGQNGCTPGNVVLSIARKVATANKNAIDNRGGDTLVTDSFVLCDYNGHRIAGVSAGIRPDIGHVVQGVVLLKRQAIPEVVVKSAAGRRFGEVFSGQPHLSQRVIRSIVTDDDGYAEITLNPCDVMLSDIVRLGCHEALEHINAVINH